LEKLVPMHAITYIKSQLISKSKDQILIISNTNFWCSRRQGRTRTMIKNTFLHCPIMHQPGGIEKTCAHACPVGKQPQNVLKNSLQ
jgi:hypothetical protein